MAIFFDTHAHLDYPEYEQDFSEILARAQAAGITKIISIGTSLDSGRRAIALAEKFRARLAALVSQPDFDTRFLDSAPDKEQAQKALSALKQLLARTGLG